MTKLPTLIAFLFLALLQGTTCHAQTTHDFSPNDFSFRLYQSLAKTEEASFFVSPISLYAALSLASGGAAGTTAREFYQLLGNSPDELDFHARNAALFAKIFPQPSLLENVFSPFASMKGEPIIKIANALWAGERLPFKPEFVGWAEKTYEAIAKNTNDKNIINRWAADATEQKITELLTDNLRPDQSVITNAVYFKGDWASQFKVSATHDAPFYRLDGSTLTAQLMQQEAEFDYFSDDALQAVRLPYQGERLAMVVLLPKQSGAAALQELEARLSNPFWHSLLANLQPRKLEVFLPKFSSKSAFDVIKKNLKELGLHQAFDRYAADFSRMLGPGAFIGDVIQKTFIKLDEQGTEAAAATAIIFELLSAPVVPTFRADRPFLYLIVDQPTQTVLFIGRQQGNF